MAKRFFYNRVYNTKRMIINGVIIGACIIGIIVCFIITANFQGEFKNEPQGNISIKKEVTVEVNQQFSNDIFFSKVENFDIKDAKIELPQNFDIGKVGIYDVIIKINDKNFDSKLVVIDTTRPELELKDLSIMENEKYEAKNFVSSCTDNTKEECKIMFADSLDENGKAINYGNYSSAGTYPIKITAMDASGNKNTKETTLTIKKNEKEVPKTPVTPTNCKYGNNEYDKDEYLLALDVTNNGCALSIDSYYDETLIAKYNEILEKDRIRLLKDIEKINISGTISLNRTITVIINNSAKGLVGYGLGQDFKVVNKGKTTDLAVYKIDANGKRHYSSNPYNLPE